MKMKHVVNSFWHVASSSGPRGVEAPQKVLNGIGVVGWYLDLDVPNDPSQKREELLASNRNVCRRTFTRLRHIYTSLDFNSVQNLLCGAE